MLTEYIKNKLSTKLSILFDHYPAEEAITRKASPIRLCSPWSKRPSLCKQEMVSAMPCIQKLVKVNILNLLPNYTLSKEAFSTCTQVSKKMKHKLVRTKLH